MAKRRGALSIAVFQIIENEFACPVKLWRKMSNTQKLHYNAARRFNAWQVGVFEGEIGEARWKVISHNFAYLSSQLVN